MSPIGYITITADILQRPDLSDKQKMLLALIKSFNGEGFTMLNDSIAELLGIHSNYAGELLNDLDRKGYIEIKNRQSRWRKIYMNKILEVEKPLPQEKPVSKMSVLKENSLLTSRNTCNRTKGIKKREKHVFIKPIPAEVETYGQSIGFKIDGEYFCNSYESKGWMIGKNPMRDWKAAVRTWRDRDKAKGKSQDGGDNGVMMTQESTEAEADELLKGMKP